MEFHDLKRQYSHLMPQIDQAIKGVCQQNNFISGTAVRELEESLAEYVGVKHCITCANGTDALELSLRAWDLGKGDAVFVPDFTFFATAEAPALLGLTPIFVDVDKDTFNMDAGALELAIKKMLEDGILVPKVIITVDLFGRPAQYDELENIARKYKLYMLEDGAQGFGGEIRTRKACSFGDISTTSFFPVKPLGCYGDGGAIFTNNDEWAKRLRSLCVHGKGSDKYDNIMLGRNSRLDTMQAAILQVKLKAFIEFELEAIQKVAEEYSRCLDGYVKTPVVLEGYLSSWAQYTICLPDAEHREQTQMALQKEGIPSAVYYNKPVHEQKAFESIGIAAGMNENSAELSRRVLSLPINPYLEVADIHRVTECIINHLR